MTTFPPHWDPVRERVTELVEEMLRHDGHAELAIEVRILKRGQKEVLIRCGKHYRYVVDVAASDGAG